MARLGNAEFRFTIEINAIGTIARVSSDEYTRDRRNT